MSSSLRVKQLPETTIRSLRSNHLCECCSQGTHREFFGCWGHKHRNQTGHILKRNHENEQSSGCYNRDFLAYCRPLKVHNYLKSEAVRLCRAQSNKMAESEIKEILQKMNKQLLPNTDRCFHGRDFLHRIASF